MRYRLNPAFLDKLNAAESDKWSRLRGHGYNGWDSYLNRKIKTEFASYFYIFKIKTMLSYFLCSKAYERFRSLNHFICAIHQELSLFYL